MISKYIPKYLFSTPAAIAQRTFSKFSERYAANLQ